MRLKPAARLILQAASRRSSTPPPPALPTASSASPSRSFLSTVGVARLLAPPLQTAKGGPPPEPRSRFPPWVPHPLVCKGGEELVEGVARLGRFELPASGSGDQRSIQLSYRRVECSQPPF